MAASVVQEYYKVQDCWSKIDSDKTWRMALWVVEFHDVEIVSGFMGVEASPIGKFNDIFFHFTSEYTGDYYAFEEKLYNEYLSWFDESQKRDIDILEALKNDNMLLEAYQPDTELAPTAENLWAEMLRFKSCIKGLEDRNFCVYFQIPRTDAKGSTGFFKDIIKRGVPEGIRLTTIDYAKKRKVKLDESSKVVILRPELNMAEAIRNEMNKGCFNENTVGAEGRYRKLILSILTLSQHGKSKKLDKEINQLLAVSKEMNDMSAIVGSYLIASQAYFYAKDKDLCEYYSDKTISECEQVMYTTNTNLYPIWRGAIMLKASTYVAKQKRRKAIELYEKMAEEASVRTDPFYIMEGYRMSGHLYYELGQLDSALESTLLALAGGSYLEKNVIRQSTFLHASNLAIYLVEQTRGYNDLEILEMQLQEWIGDDWESLVKNDTYNKAKIRHKATIFS